MINFPERIDAELLDKLKILADLEAELDNGNISIGNSNRGSYERALQQYKEQQKIDAISRRINQNVDNNLGKELFKLYKDFDVLIHSDQEKLQEVKSLFSDEIDFNGMELDRYAVGGSLGYCVKLYLRATPEDMIYDVVDSGPNILDQIKVQFSEKGIWEAYLLYAAKDWIELAWHDCYKANDIVCQDDWKPIPPPWWGKENTKELLYPELEEGYSIPYPMVVIDGDVAYIHFVCHWQHNNTYQDAYVVVRKSGDSLRFDHLYESNTSIINVLTVGEICY